MTTINHGDIPGWLAALSWASLALAAGCAAWIAVDVQRRPQPMRVMALVWPICALFGSVAWLAAYLLWGRAPRPPPGATRGRTGTGPRTTAAVHEHGGNDHGHRHGGHGALGMSRRPRTRAVSVFSGTSHCGAGCTLADIIVEWLVFGVPAVAVAGGAHWLFADTMYANWVIAYVAALIIGIAFQYFAVAPMNPRRGRAGNLRAAAQADVLSLTAWQVGMYGAMAIAQLAVLPAWLGGAVGVATPVFWAVMQVAMLVGFATSYPVNWWLIHRGIKEAM